MTFSHPQRAAWTVVRDVAMPAAVPPPAKAAGAPFGGAGTPGADAPMPQATIPAKAAPRPPPKAPPTQPTRPDELVEPGWIKHAHITERTFTDGAMRKLSSGAREATPTSAPKRADGQSRQRDSASGSMAAMISGASTRARSVDSRGHARCAREMSSSTSFFGPGLDMAAVWCVLGTTTGLGAPEHMPRWALMCQNRDTWPLSECLLSGVAVELLPDLAPGF